MQLLLIEAGICEMVNPPLCPISHKIDLHQLQNILYWNALSQPQRVSSLAVVAFGLFWNGHVFQWVILQELKHHCVHTTCLSWDKGLSWLYIISSIYIRAALKLILREISITALSCQRNSWFNCWTPRQTFLVPPQWNWSFHRGQGLAVPVVLSCCTAYGETSSSWNCYRLCPVVFQN